jgi:Family of unknown function (DUF6209)
MQTGESSDDMEGDGGAVSTATLRFRHSEGTSGVSRHGHIRPGGKLVVEYDPARLPPAGSAPSASTDILCHLEFRPVRQSHTGSVLEPGGHGVSQTGSRPATLEVLVPAGTTEVELWFERCGPAGATTWDSCYGQNYTFSVVGEGLPIPERSVVLRPEAVVDASTIRVVEDTAVKEAVGMGATGKQLRTLLVVRALAADPTAAPDAWADVHVFDAAGELIQAGSIAFHSSQRTADPGLRVWEDEVYQGSGGGSGMGVWSRPDAHTIQYRLYCAIRDQVFTDGVLHQFEVPADEDVRRTLSRG